MYKLSCSRANSTLPSIDAPGIVVGNVSKSYCHKGIERFIKVDNKITQHRAFIVIRM